MVVLVQIPRQLGLVRQVPEIVDITQAAAVLVVTVLAVQQWLVLVQVELAAVVQVALLLQGKEPAEQPIPAAARVELRPDGPPPARWPRR